MPRLAQKVLNVIGGNTCIHETELKSDNHALKTLLNIEPSSSTGGSTNGTKKWIQIGSGGENLRGFASHVFVRGSPGFFEALEERPKNRKNPSWWPN
jgi:hypothetical protein